MSAKPCERPDEDVLRDFREDLWSLTEPRLVFDYEIEHAQCEVKTIEIVKGLDDAILCSAELQRAFQARPDAFYMASIVWWLQSATPCIINGRNSWRCVYRVDVE